MKKPFLLLAAALALPISAHAQWASSITEHDWRLTLGGASFGLVQQAVYTVTLTSPTSRTTTIYLGPLGAPTTRVPAPFLAVILMLPLGAGAALLLRSLLTGKATGTS